MNFLKKLPLEFKGELHQVQLINFSVEKEEVISYVPEAVKIRDVKGRAMISMVNVELRNMRPSFAPALFSFNYQHLGFRLLVDDSAWNEGKKKGIFFIRSFTDKSQVWLGGSLLTDYRLEKALLKKEAAHFRLEQGNHYLQYAINKESNSNAGDPELKDMIGALDRAYSILDGRMRMVKIMREKWPIDWMKCTGFETNFFTTARFEGAFSVSETIYYQWLAPQWLA